MCNETVWEATPRQAEFLASCDHEVLYGGAVGGGKTDALLMAALCLNHPSGGVQHPRHAALILRRSKPELEELVVRSKQLYGAIWPGATYLESRYVWSFPNGARVEFDHVRDARDAQRFKGRAWNFIGFDELTLFDQPTWQVLSTRCRTSAPDLPCYMRATTNPDGPGQGWVMAYFGIAESGAGVRRPVEIIDHDRGVKRRFYRSFIPARLSDNPHLDTAAYRDRLLSLPADERAALYEGRWQRRLPEGAFYAQEMQKIAGEDRIRPVPYDASVPVSTFWDIGISDCTAIWFYQYAAGEHRFLDCYEASGESLEHYAQVLQARGYNLGGTHYLPHDAGARSLQTNKTHVEMLGELLPGLRFEIVPRAASRLAGINATRLKLGGNVFFDEVKTAAGLEALRNYRKKPGADHETFLGEPVRDRYTHLADAFRLWGELDRPDPAFGPQYPRRPRPGAMAI